jgi:hypothetical protein
MARNAFQLLISEINSIIHEFISMFREIPELQINHVGHLFYNTNFFGSSILSYY